MSAALARPLLRATEERLVLSVTLFGAPRTKKNHGRIITIGGSPRMLPSKAFCDWEKASVPVIKAAMRRAGKETITGIPLNCRALVYRDADRGDAVGYYQGIADLLESAGVVEDDKLIVSWDGSRMLIDRQRPRVEVTLEEVR